MWTKHPCSRWARSGCSDSVLGTRRWRSCHSETSNCVICIWWIFRCVHTVVTAGVNQNEPFWRFSARWNSGRVATLKVERWPGRPIYCTVVHVCVSSRQRCSCFCRRSVARGWFRVSIQIAANPWARLRLPASLGLPGFSGLNVVNRLCVNVYKYIFCMYAFPNDLEKIDVIFIYCSGCFVSILYFWYGSL